MLGISLTLMLLCHGCNGPVRYPDVDFPQWADLEASTRFTERIISHPSASKHDHTSSSNVLTWSACGYASAGVLQCHKFTSCWGQIGKKTLSIQRSVINSGLSLRFDSPASRYMYLHGVVIVLDVQCGCTLCWTKLVFIDSAPTLHPTAEDER